MRTKPETAIAAILSTPELDPYRERAPLLWWVRLRDEPEAGFGGNGGPLDDPPVVVGPPHHVDHGADPDAPARPEAAPDDDGVSPGCRR